MTTHDVANYEFILVVEGIADAFDPKVERIEEHFDCIVEHHSELTLVTLTATGRSAFVAGVDAVRTLESFGVHVVRTYPDLVTRQDIADRAEVTRQAVGNWVRGERSGSIPFPRPVHLAAGGLWLWADIHHWLTDRGLPAEAIEYPSLTTHTHLDNWLMSRGQRADESAFAEVGYIAASPRFNRSTPVDMSDSRFEPWTAA
jgi:hypothetical protein